MAYGVVIARLFATLAVLSLVLAVALAGLWVRSQFAADSFGYRTAPEGEGIPEDRWVGVASGRGMVLVMWARSPSGQPAGWERRTGPADDFGVGPSSGVRVFATHAWFPIWPAILGTLVLPGWWVLRRWRRWGAGRGFAVREVPREEGGPVTRP